MTTKITLLGKTARTADAPGESKVDLLEPFFHSREENLRIRRSQSQAERAKFADAFAIVGCIRCGTKDRPHAACGFCASCYTWYAHVLRKVVLARLKAGKS
jgi:hypothetical protein